MWEKRTYRMGKKGHVINTCRMAPLRNSFNTPSLTPVVVGPGDRSKTNHQRRENRINYYLDTSDENNPDIFMSTSWQQPFCNNSCTHTITTPKTHFDTIYHHVIYTPGANTLPTKSSRISFGACTMSGAGAGTLICGATPPTLPAPPMMEASSGLLSRCWCEE